MVMVCVGQGAAAVAGAEPNEISGMPTVRCRTPRRFIITPNSAPRRQMSSQTSASDFRKQPGLCQSDILAKKLDKVAPKRS